MTEVMTTKEEPPPGGGAVERRARAEPADRPPEVDDGVREPVVWGVMRPVWMAPAGTYSHQPEISEHPTLWQVDLPRPRARKALVVVTRRRRPVLLWGDGSPSRLELFLSRGTLYEVDLGLHHTSFELDLPSSGDTFTFRADVSVEWRVNQPVTVVLDNLADIREALAPVVRHGLCEITRGFGVEEVIAAERAVTSVLHTLNPGRVYGLTMMLGIRLSADTGAAEYAASRRDLQQKIVIEKLKHEHRSLKVDHEQKVMKSRMGVYRDIIDKGSVEQLALQLAQNPSGVESIAALVREEHERDRVQVTDFISRLLSSGAIDRWDVEDHVRVALEWLKESTDRTVQTGHAHIPQQRRSSPNGANGNGNHNGRSDAGTEQTVDFGK